MTPGLERSALQIKMQNYADKITWHFEIIFGVFGGVCLRSLINNEEFING
jgi:hypothetical protein